MRLSFVVIVLLVATLFWKFSGYHVDASSKKPDIQKAPPMDVSFERMEARTHLNSIREAMGLRTLLQNDHLNKASQSHSDYLVVNNKASHYESATDENFSGERPADRAHNAGYHSSKVTENLSTKNHTAHSSIDGLFSAIYHRFGFLDPSIDEIGVGVTQNASDSEKSAFVYLMGNSKLNTLCTNKSFKGYGRYVYKACKKSDHKIAKKPFVSATNRIKQKSPKIIVYPYDGQDEVPPVFYDETPDPLPDHDVSGFPVSVEFNDYYFKNVELHSFKLFDQNNKEVDNLLLMDKDSDPHKLFSANQFAIFPLERLEYDTKYRAELLYSWKGKQKSLSWDFKTKKPTEELHIITQKEQSIKVASSKSHIFYFKPLNQHDLIQKVNYPKSVDVTFIDNNTLKVTPMNSSVDSFDIVSETRVLHVEYM